MTPPRFYGKYRGSVLNNVDPEQRGRLLVTVPDVLGSMPSSWALPCVPVAGPQMGSWFVPPIGAGVWVEYEQGDPDHPIWVGCFWGSAAEVPAVALAAPPATPNIVLQTTGQATLVLSDVPAVGIVLKTLSGAMITINETGILLSNGRGATIAMAGPSVMVNNTALVVT